MITKEPGISIKRIRHHIENLKKIFSEPPPIVKATLEDMEGLYGALTLIKK